MVVATPFIPREGRVPYLIDYDGRDTSVVCPVRDAICPGSPGISMPGRARLFDRLR